MIVELLLFLACLAGYKVWRMQQMMGEYWQKKGVKVPKFAPLIGNNPFLNMDIIMQRKNVNGVVKEQYDTMKGEKLYGIYSMGKPGLVILDPNLVKQVITLIIMI